jgi:hypothetical protein
MDENRRQPSCREHAELTQQAEIVPQCHMLHDLPGMHPIEMKFALLKGLARWRMP